MTSYKFAIRGLAAILFGLLAGATASAASHSDRGYGCLLSRAFSNVHRVVTVCVARSPEARARLTASNCDPAMSDAAMRVLCGGPRSQGDTSAPATAG